MNINFTKMQGAGNDYIYINEFEETVKDPFSLAIAMSDRHFGVGSDGLVLIGPSKKADLRMRMFNADGTEAEMCGNASRCVGKYAYEHGLVRKDSFNLETGAGIKRIKLLIEDGKVKTVTVDMGEPVLEPAQIPYKHADHNKTPLVSIPIVINGEETVITPVGMGNPHCVRFIENTENLELDKIGPCYERHANFPARTNTEFVEILSRNSIKMRVWERGAGETLACGTGACAALVAAVLNNLSDDEAEVVVRGGVLKIKWNRQNNHIYMSGPAETVFTGVYEIKQA